MKHFFTIFLAMILIFGSTSFAETSTAPECGTFNKVVTSQYSIFTSVYPQSLITTAQKNHWNYCCAKHPNTTPPEMDQYCADNKLKAGTYADSPWLYDHLVDVGFRYLDGVPELQYEGAVVDTKWWERKTTISEAWSNPYGAIPLDIMNKYKTYRWDRTKSFEIMQSQQQTCPDSITRFEEYNRTWNTLPLAQKYFIICELSSCMANAQKNAFLPYCQQLAKERVINEDDYVQALLITQWQQALQTNFDVYARSYMNHQRLNELLVKFVTMAKGIGFVDNKVPEMTRMCSA